MANSDGSVEVRITGSIDPSLSSSVKAADAQISGLASNTTVSAGKMAEALRAVGGDVRKITPEMLGMGGAAASAAATAVPALRATEVATHGVNFATSGAIQEYIRLGHEAMQGNFSRMPGSLVVLTSRMGGLTAATFVAGGAIAITAGAAAYLIYQAAAAEQEVHKLADGFELTGRSATMSANGVRSEIAFLSQLPGVNRAAATSFLQYVAAHASIDPILANETGQLLPRFIEQLGKQGPQAAGKLTETLSNLTEEGFRRLDHELLNLSPAEYELIENLIRTGQEAEAVNRIMAALSRQSGIYIKTLGDQVYDVEQKIQAVRERMAGRHGEFGAGQIQTDISELKQLQAELAHIRNLEHQGDTQSKDNRYKAELDAAHQITNSLHEREGIEKRIAQFARDKNEAVKRGDISGIAQFSQAEVDEQKKLNDLDFRNFSDKETAKSQLYKSGSAERIGYATQEVAEAKRLFGSESNEYYNALAKLNSEKRAASTQAEAQSKRDAREAAREAKQAAEERLRAIQEETASFREGSGERVDAALAEYRLATQLFGQYSSQGKTAYGEYTRAVVAFNHEQGQSAEDTARDKIKNDEEFFTEASRNLDDLLSKDRITGQQFIAESAAVEAARFADTEAWLYSARAALLLVGEDTRQIDRAIEDESRRHQKVLADNARRGADAEIAERRRVNSQYLSAQDSFISSYLAGQTSLWTAAKQAFAQFLTQEIVADARMWAERALLAAEGQSAINAAEKGGMLFHLFAEATKTGETATQTGEQVATVAAGETAKTGAVAASQAAQVGIVAAGSAAKSTVAAAGDSKSILNAAYVSAAEAYKSVMEAVPPPFNLVLAPLAAAGTFAAVAAWDLVSAEGGEYMVRGNGVSYRLHDREAVMPASVADPMRNFFERGGDTNSVNNGGDINLHMPVTINGSPNKIDLEDALRTHRSAIYRWAQNEHANGNLRKLALGR
jgi:hypothetical protein